MFHHLFLNISNILLFHNIKKSFQVTRYHSLIINQNNLPNDLEVTAWTNKGLIMACKHKKYNNLQGIQFHPESLWTEQGKTIIRNFLKLN